MAEQNYRKSNEPPHSEREKKHNRLPARPSVALRSAHLNSPRSIRQQRSVLRLRRPPSHHRPPPPLIQYLCIHGGKSEGDGDTPLDSRTTDRIRTNTQWPRSSPPASVPLLRPSDPETPLFLPLPHWFAAAGRKEGGNHN